MLKNSIWYLAEHLLCWRTCWSYWRMLLVLEVTEEGGGLLPDWWGISGQSRYPYPWEISVGDCRIWLHVACLVPDLWMGINVGVGVQTPLLWFISATHFYIPDGISMRHKYTNSSKGSGSEAETRALPCGLSIYYYHSSTEPPLLPVALLLPYYYVLSHELPTPQRTQATIVVILLLASQ